MSAITEALKDDIVDYMKTTKPKKTRAKKPKSDQPEGGESNPSPLVEKPAKPKAARTAKPAKSSTGLIVAAPPLPSRVNAYDHLATSPNRVLCLDQAHGKNWSVFRGDCVEIIKGVPDESVHFSVYSPPFKSLYVYSNSERDMGNCKEPGEFFQHYTYLIHDLLRVTKPGRLSSVHCMNLPTTISHHGFIGIDDFRGDIIRAHQSAGWILHSEVVIWKDPVTAMQRTKALGLLHKQVVKDSCMSRQGIPDYLLTFRKPGKNVEPVEGEFDRWIGDDSFASAGQAAYEKACAKYQQYLELKTDEERWDWVDCGGIHEPPIRRNCESVAGTRLSIDVWQRFASPIWMDINATRTLQYMQARQADDERHICPLQLDVIERAMEMWSNPGDVILSPFGGIGSEGYVSVLNSRKSLSIELKDTYFEANVRNHRLAESEAKNKSRTLMDWGEKQAERQVDPQPEASRPAMNFDDL